MCPSLRPVANQNAVRPILVRMYLLRKFSRHRCIACSAKQYFPCSSWCVSPVYLKIRAQKKQLMKGPSVQNALQTGKTAAGPKHHLQAYPEVGVRIRGFAPVVGNTQRAPQTHNAFPEIKTSPTLGDPRPPETKYLTQHAMALAGPVFARAFGHYPLLLWLSEPHQSCIRGAQRQSGRKAHTLFGVPATALGREKASSV